MLWSEVVSLQQDLGLTSVEGVLKTPFWGRLHPHTGKSALYAQLNLFTLDSWVLSYLNQSTPVYKAMASAIKVRSIVNVCYIDDAHAIVVHTRTALHAFQALGNTVPHKCHCLRCTIDYQCIQPVYWVQSFGCPNVTCLPRTLLFVVMSAFTYLLLPSAACEIESTVRTLCVTGCHRRPCHRLV